MHSEPGSLERTNPHLKLVVDELTSRRYAGMKAISLWHSAETPQRKIVPGLAQINRLELIAFRKVTHQAYTKSGDNHEAAAQFIGGQLTRANHERAAHLESLWPSLELEPAEDTADLGWDIYNGMRAGILSVVMEDYLEALYGTQRDDAYNAMLVHRFPLDNA